MQTNSSIEQGRGGNGQLLSPHETWQAAVWFFRLIASIHGVLLRWWRLGCGLLRGLLRLAGLGVVLVMALADTAIIRLTTDPSATALARSRTKWFHRWSAVLCRILGLEVGRHGFLPASGLVIVNHLGLLDALLLASVGPFVFVVDMGLRRRPVVGMVARLAGALFRDRQRRSDVVRINFMIERALKRRQLVVVSSTCDCGRGPALNGIPSALLQPAVDTHCSLTAATIGNKHPAFWSTAAGILMQPRSRISITFHPPVFHHGDRKQLAEQVWSEVQALESSGIIADGAFRLVEERLLEESISPQCLVTPTLQKEICHGYRDLVLD